MSKRSLSETDIITKYIMPAIQQAGWDLMTQIRQEVKLRDGKVIIQGSLGSTTNPTSLLLSSKLKPINMRWVKVCSKG